jgi:hypothetical protein
MRCVLLHLAKKLLRLSLLKGVYFAISPLFKIAFLCCFGHQMCANFLKKEVLKRNK